MSEEKSPEVCAICDEYEPELIQVDNKEICSNCCDENYTVCDRCSDITHNDSILYDSDGCTPYCESCYEIVMRRCTFCSEFDHRDRVMSDRFDNIACESCSDGVGFCHDCGVLSDYDYLYYRESHDDYFCEDCDPGDDHHHLISSYHTKPSCGLIFYGDESKLFFGLEVEVEFDDSSFRNDYLDRLDRWANIKYRSLHHVCVPQEDGSLDSETGVELVFQPHTLEAYKTLINSIPLPDEDELNINSGVGIHVNMSRDYATDEAWARFIRFIYLNADFWSAQSLRNSSRWAAIGEDMNINLDDPYFSSDKYIAVNMKNYGRVEVRTFKSIFTKEHISNAVYLCSDLIEFCKVVKNEAFKRLEQTGQLLASFLHFREHKTPLTVFFHNPHTGSTHLVDMGGLVYKRVMVKIEVEKAEEVSPNVDPVQSAAQAEEDARFLAEIMDQLGVL